MEKLQCKLHSYMGGMSKTPATKHLFKVNDKAKK